MPRSKWFSLLLLAVILTTAVLHLLHLKEPWEGGLKGTIGLRHSAQFAGHFVQFGFQFTSFTPIHFMVGDVPMIYYHHPATFPLLIGLCYQVLGISLWAARIIPLLACLGTLVLTFRWVKRIYNREVALLATAIVSILPVFFWHGTLVWFEGTTVFLMLASLIAYHRFMTAPSGRSFALLLICMSLAMLIDWPAYLLVPVLLVDYYLVERQKRLFFLLLPGLGSIIFVVTNLHFYFATGLVECIPFYSLIAYGQVSREEFDLGEWFVAHWKDQTEWITLPVYATAFCYLIVAVFRHRLQKDRWLFNLMILGFAYLAIFHRHSADHEFFLMYLVLPYSLTFAVALHDLGHPSRPRIARLAALSLLGVAAYCCINENINHRHELQPEENIYPEWVAIQKGESPSHIIVVDTYYQIIDLMHETPDEVMAFIDKERKRPHKKHLLVGVLDPAATDDPVERARRERVVEVMEREYTHLIDYQRVRLFINE